MVGMESLERWSSRRVRVECVTDVMDVKTVAKPVTAVTICDWCAQGVKPFQPKTGFFPIP